MPLLVLLLTLFVTRQATPPPVGPDAATRAKAVIASMAEGNFAVVEAQFSGAMKTALPVGQLAARWNAILTQAGAFKGCSPESRAERLPGIDAVIMTCRFERVALDARIAFNSAGALAGLSFRPAAAPVAPYTSPDYANPSAYAEEELTFGAPEWSLPATLTMPGGPGPFPALVLVHGSGPNDRDGTLGANKPLKDLALGLASRGIAVLRYDKRSKVHGAKLATLPTMTVKEEVIDDVAAAVTALRAHDRIDRARVFVLGHSLGGMLIPRIATANPSLAGAIVLAGAARPLEDAIVEQTRYLAMSDGAISPDEQSQIAAATTLAATVKALTPQDAAAGRNVSGAPASYWLDLRGYDAPAAAAKVKLPLLVLQGERDYQVTMAEFTRWKAALGARPNVSFHSYPALNHLFLAGTGPSTPAEYQIPSHVAEEVVRDIAAWILSRGQTPEGQSRGSDPGGSE